MRRLYELNLAKNSNEYHISYCFRSCKRYRDLPCLFIVQYTHIIDLTTINRLLNKVKFGPYNLGNNRSIHMHMHEYDLYTEHITDYEEVLNVSSAHRHDCPFIYIEDIPDKMFLIKDGIIIRAIKSKGKFYIQMDKCLKKYVRIDEKIDISYYT